MTPFLMPCISSLAPAIIRTHRHLALPDADGFDDDDIETRRLAYEDGFAGLARHAAEGTARGRGSDKRAGAPAQFLHAHLVAKDAAPGNRARRVDREHCHAQTLVGKMTAERLDEGAFAGTWNARDADTARLARVRQKFREQLLRRVLVGGRVALDEGDGPAQHRRIVGEHAGGIVVDGKAGAARQRRCRLGGRGSVVRFHPMHNPGGKARASFGWNPVGTFGGAAFVRR